MKVSLKNIVVGSGFAGLATLFIFASIDAKNTIVEKSEISRGCHPQNTTSGKTARFFDLMRGGIATTLRNDENCRFGYTRQRQP